MRTLHCCGAAIVILAVLMTACSKKSSSTTASPGTESFGANGQQAALLSVCDTGSAYLIVGTGVLPGSKDTSTMVIGLQVNRQVYPWFIDFGGAWSDTSGTRGLAVELTDAKAGTLYWDGAAASVHGTQFFYLTITSVGGGYVTGTFSGELYNGLGGTDSIRVSNGSFQARFE